MQAFYRPELHVGVRDGSRVRGASVATSKIPIDVTPDKDDPAHLQHAKPAGFIHAEWPPAFSGWDPEEYTFTMSSGNPVVACLVSTKIGEPWNRCAKKLLCQSFVEVCDSS